MHGLKSGVAAHFSLRERVVLEQLMQGTRVPTQHRFERAGLTNVHKLKWGLRYPLFLLLHIIQGALLLLLLLLLRL